LPEDSSSHRALSRFSCPTSALDLGWLSKDARLSLAMAALISFGIHAFLAGINISSEEERAVKPLVSKFIKREPRLVKPLELRKRPKPKPRPMRRKVVMVKAKISRREMFQPAASPLKVLDSLARPRGGITREVSFEPVQLEGYFGSAVIEGDKEPEERIDMDLEMLDVDALDVGRYHAVVIQDPRDKRKIRGFFHVALVYSKNFNRREHHDQDIRGQWAIRRLVDAMNRYTDIRTDIIGTYTFECPEILKIPWILVRALTSFRLTESETENIGRYLVSGGFMFAEIVPYFGVMAVDTSFRLMFKEALATQGLRWRGEQRGYCSMWRPTSLTSGITKIRLTPRRSLLRSTVSRCTDVVGR